jgi:hypothetical protein
LPEFVHYLFRPYPDYQGRIAIVTSAGWDAVDAKGASRREADKPRLESSWLFEK